LPVYGVPEIAVSSVWAFTRLAVASNPTDTMTTEVERDCAQSVAAFGGCTAEHAAGRRLLAISSARSSR
jgi:hypothetical protein